MLFPIRATARYFLPRPQAKEISDPSLVLATMAPDLNSLPPSRSVSSSPMQVRTIYPSALPMDSHYHQPHGTPSPLSSNVSLAAAASMNAADISRRSSVASMTNRGSPRAGRASDRRRSVVAMNLNLNDPTLPSPGELSSHDRRASFGHSFAAASPSSIGGTPMIATGDPHHHRRNPSLGEIHQELEQEQEAQVNRLLQMIRTQQTQLEHMQRYQQEHAARQSSQSGTATAGNNNNQAVADESTPTSERSFTLTQNHNQPQPLPRLPRRSSRPASQSTSPILRPLPGLDHGVRRSSVSENWPPSPVSLVRRNSSRDESAYYQAETATLTRENQMLRLRIRELERQVGEMNSSPANTPAISSNLSTSPPLEARDRAVVEVMAMDADKD